MTAAPALDLCDGVRALHQVRAVARGTVRHGDVRRGDAPGVAVVRVRIRDARVIRRFRPPGTPHLWCWTGTARVVPG